MGSESFSALGMDLGKHKGEASTRDTVWKEKMKVPSESGFLKFTFVPAFGRLPTQHHIADDPSSMVSTGGRPADKDYQENTRNRHRTGAEEEATGSGKKGNSSRNSSQKRSSGGMDKEDLFKAEFVVFMDSDEDTKAAMHNGYGIERTEHSATSNISPRSETIPRVNAPQACLHTDPPCSPSSHPKHAQIKTSYKAFAAIPTNTLLLEQKALDEPTTGEGVIEDRTLDTHSEMCSPAQLRQQTEELCAAIDQVLQDPLAMRRCDSSPSSLQNIRDSDLSKLSTPSQRSVGRETRFANLYLSGPIVTESQKTKPGVIRPTIVKAKIIVKEEEPVQPNPFKKYLEETIDLQIEQDSSLSHAFLHTKLNPPTKSPLHLQTFSFADSLTPGPFNHLGSIFGDVYNNSYSPYHHNALYNKPTHPIVPIPEDEALSSKELCSTTIKDKAHVPLYQEKKDTRKESSPDNGGPHSKAQRLLRRDLGNGVGKSS
ncbi:muscular LMNA-interacting protein isoform X6 [Anolis carolinensis]|uniref:Muscular LMNA interacting protein n=1 Tax=Anolis carolinensis TaxID=28377 RepID=A0A803TT81_ANOCA|nr:PREDICTED: muscular LMNA-interacting protein isoform X5 [Anolis carolinensis]|eukprot:XP_003226110.2 PREDICTED: muscular LMNA-interacting protein isoform X5 [Anolis carolinensis]